MKICKRCNIEKDLSEYYKHKLMSDGHLNICKKCKKEESADNYSINMLDPKFIEKERLRAVDKYNRLNANWKKPSKEIRAKRTNNYKKNFPEKYEASKACQKLDKEEGFNLHHWSYNEEHYLDVIKLQIDNHYKIHKYLIYDQEHMMYRTTTNDLLDTKNKHINYIMNLPF